jgi:Na+/H+ antiporter NhaD/arsenite permease-like protein
MMSALTVAVLTLALAGRPNSGTGAVGDQRKSLRAVLDLPPMFLGASAIRALLGAGLTLHGGFVEQLGGGSVFAAALNNLPAAAAVHATGATGRWAAVLAMAIGSNLLVTGSVATLICRRIARDAGVQFGAARFSLLGLAFVPLQILAAAIGLHATGVLP